MSTFLTNMRYRIKKFTKQWRAPLLVGLLCYGIAEASLYFSRSAAGAELELLVLRSFYQVRPDRPTPEQVIIAAIDDQTYKKLEASTNYPLPRRYIATALKNIAEAKPRNLILDAKLPKETWDKDADMKIAKVLSESPSSIWSGQVPASEYEKIDVHNKDSFGIPSDELFRKAAKMELPMTITGAFGYLYRMSHGNNPKAHLYERVPIAKPLVELGGFHIETPGLDDAIHFYGPPGKLKRISLYDVIYGKKEELQKLFADKVVLFGYQSISYGRGQMDKEEFHVPVSNQPMFGVEIHGHLIANLLDESWLKKISPSKEVMIIFFSAMWMALLGIKWRQHKSIPAILLLIGLMYAAAYYAFSYHGYWFTGTGAIALTGVLIIVCGACYNSFLKKSFEEYIKKTFQFGMGKKL